MFQFVVSYLTFVQYLCRLLPVVPAARLPFNSICQTVFSLAYQRLHPVCHHFLSAFNTFNPDKQQWIQTHKNFKNSSFCFSPWISCHAQHTCMSVVTWLLSVSRLGFCGCLRLFFWRQLPHTAFTRWLMCHSITTKHRAVPALTSLTSGSYIPIISFDELTTL